MLVVTSLFNLKTLTTLDINLSYLLIVNITIALNKKESYKEKY